jgi:hypothetical protein
VTVVLLILLLAAMVSPSAADAAGAGDVAISAQTASFLDVPAGPACVEAIEQIAHEGIVEGYVVNGGYEFRSAKPLLRAQYAKMVVNTLGLPAAAEGSQTPFRDLGAQVDDDPYPHEFVATALSAGIVKGRTATRFAPWDKVTRAQAVTMVVRAVQTFYPQALETPPPGYKNSWGVAFNRDHGPLARLAEFNDLLSGLPLQGAAKDPWGPMPRGEVAQVLANALDLVVSDLSGTVRGPAGEVIPSVSVQILTPMAEGLGSADTDADGAYLLESTLGDLRAAMFFADPARRELPVVVRTFNDKGYVDEYYRDEPAIFHRASDITEYIDLSTGSATADFTLEKGYQIAGKVTTSAGAPLAGAVVFASASARVVGRTDVTGVDGTYAITGLPAAEYTVMAQLDTKSAFYEPGANVTGDLSGIDIVLDP